MTERADAVWPEFLERVLGDEPKPELQRQKLNNASPASTDVSERPKTAPAETRSPLVQSDPP
ncbi:hypothetical protein [Falsiroseomonas tokyonensis]|uniref:Uncharacterized protein n=1 Tax=Falsiroseomonas tokyonensis TaxID=430521 RepID=A0ABV7C1B1_9PROT|nr:hypothetical protein [Falsiroseomonas tokyonensis]MBU8541650.1 hypothetical protein [Falsiroseomonas tokyonensis]